MSKRPEMHWNQTHGEARHTIGKTPEFLTWVAIKTRCYNKKDKAYPCYGGRGIRIFTPWLISYDAFLAYVGRRPSPEHSIDRINNNGDYEPGNVRWATKIEQANNTRTNRFLEFNGKSQTEAQWARELGIPNANISQRLKNGWSVDRVLGTATLPYNRYIEFNGARRTLAEWARALGIPYKVLHNRIQMRNWSIEKALTQALRVRKV